MKCRKREIAEPGGFLHRVYSDASERAWRTVLRRLSIPDRVKAVLIGALMNDLRSRHETP
jgi:hypothetical protein